MASRRDQVDAYRFARSRMLTAVLRGRRTQAADADDGTRRASRLSLASVVIGAVALAAVAGYGLAKPGGSTGWRTDGAFVVDRSSGAAFVYVGGRLHPALNTASARLVSKTGVTPTSVTSGQLASVPRGLPFGIAGAPDALPAADRVRPARWTVCTAAAGGSAARPATTTVVAAGVAGRALTAGQGVLVSDSSGKVLVWDGRQLAVTDQVLQALGYSTEQSVAVPVQDSWLGAVPAFPALRLITVPHLGAPVTRPSGPLTRVGQVARVDIASGAQYFLALADGVVHISATTAFLVLAAPGEQGLYGGRPGPVAASSATIAAAPVSATKAVGNAFAPPTPPTLVPVAAGAAAAPLCLVDSLRTTSGPLAVMVGAPGATGSLAALPTGAHGTQLADDVYVPPGSGALVRAVPRVGATTGTVYLVTDLGVRYPIPDAQSLKQLGYAASSIEPVTATLVDTLPEGPALSTGAAGRQQPS